MTNTLCEAIRHDLHPGGAPITTPVGAPCEIQAHAPGAEA